MTTGVIKSDLNFPLKNKSIVTFALQNPNFPLCESINYKCLSFYYQNEELKPTHIKKYPYVNFDDNFIMFLNYICFSILVNIGNFYKKADDYY